MEPVTTSYRFNLEIEQNLLACLILRPDAYDVISDEIKPIYFYSSEHAHIYEAIVRLKERGKAATPAEILLTVPSDVMRRDDLKKYIQDICYGLNGSFHKDWASMIRLMWQQRRYVDMASSMISMATSADLEALEQIDDRIYDIYSQYSNDNSENDAPKTIDQVIERYFADLDNDRSTVIQTGIRTLDDIIGGIAPGDVCTVAAATGMGKTVFALTLADNLTLQGKRVVYYSLEMQCHQIMARLTASATGIGEKQQRLRNLSPQDRERLIEATERFRKRLLMVGDKDVTTDRIARHIRRITARQPIDCVIIDHLGLITPAKAENRTSEVTKITREIKQMAMRYDVPIILLSQINRGVASRDNKRPVLSDLRDSGSIEQDSNQVLIIFREYQYLKDQDPPAKDKKESLSAYNERLADWHAARDAARDKAEIIVAKNRHGETGTAFLKFDGLRSRMEG